MQTPIQLNTVGKIEQGRYAGWYILVIPKSAQGFGESYTVYVCSDTSFAFAPGERDCFDEWVENRPSLEGLFEDHYPVVTWHPEIAPPVFRDSARANSLIERMRTRKPSAPPDDGDQANS